MVNESRLERLAPLTGVIALVLFSVGAALLGIYNYLLLSPLKEELDRELNPVTIRAREFKENVDRGDCFTQSILEEPKIFLIGDDDGLQALAGRRPT